MNIKHDKLIIAVGNAVDQISDAVHLHLRCTGFHEQGKDAGKVLRIVWHATTAAAITAAAIAGVVCVHLSQVASTAVAVFCSSSLKGHRATLLLHVGS